jgi:hypothetical protein
VVAVQQHEGQKLNCTNFFSRFSAPKLFINNQNEEIIEKAASNESFTYTYTMRRLSQYVTAYRVEQTNQDRTLPFNVIGSVITPSPNLHAGYHYYRSGLLIIS